MDRFSTSLRRRNYNNRGLIRHHFVDDPVRIMPDGTLWAFLQTTYKEGWLLRSIDNGFTWTRILNNATPPSEDIWYHVNPRAQAGLDVQGPLVHLELMPDIHGIYLFTGGHSGAAYTDKYQFIDTDSLVAQSTSFAVIAAGKAIEGVFATSAYQHWIAIAHVDAADANLGIDRFSPYDGSLAGEVDEASYNWVNRFDLVANGQTGMCDIVIMSDDNNLRHVRYNFASHSYGAVHQIAVSDVASVAVARDGYNTLCTVWGQITGGAVTIKYAISKDNGATWAVTTPTVGGLNSITDGITGEHEARVDIIGGSDGGFLFTYVRSNNAAPPVKKLYIQQITTADGITYTEQTQREATSRPAADNIVGGHFFKPSEDTLVPLAIPGFVRIAYQIDEGSSELMQDATPVGFGQELLLSSAFPLPAVALPETAPNQDFYAAGMTGTKTTSYLDAFAAAGTTMRLRQYEPLADAQMGDRSAYGLPTTSDVDMMVDPKSYGFPIPGLNTDDTLAWIEKDVRKVFLPPDEALLRTFVLNAGNHLKRTVWTILLDGNEYELSQVVPRFVDNQICFYEVNAYVIGPSRDPWARIVLPSET